MNLNNLEILELEQKMKSIKKELRIWESDFAFKEGRKPNKLDISNNKDIARYYKLYAKLKNDLFDLAKTSINVYQQGFYF